MANNFQVFDESGTNMMSDADYTNDSQRQDGVVPGIAPPALHNKLYRQTSIMVAALAQYIEDQGQNPTDEDFDDLLAAITAAFAPTSAFTTGMGMDFWGASGSVPSGWVLAYGTIGNGSSNATNRANSDTEALFTLIWNAYSNTEAPIYSSAGSATTRGANAAADWAANKAISLPDKRGRVSVGLDNMGGSAAGRITNSSTGGSNSTTLGGSNGSQTVTLDASMVPALSGTTLSSGAHTHPFTTASGGTHTHTASTSSSGSHNHDVSDTQTDLKSPNNLAGGTGAVVTTGSGNDLSTTTDGSHTHTVTVTSTNSEHTHTGTTDSGGTHTHDVTVNASGGGNPHSNTQPGIFCNYIIKL